MYETTETSLNIVKKILDCVLLPHWPHTLFELMVSRARSARRFWKSMTFIFITCERFVCKIDYSMCPFNCGGSSG